MSVSIEEHRLGGLRWIVLAGPEREAFGALGEHVRAELAAPDEAWPILARLRQHVSTAPGRDHLASVRRATQEQYGEEWAELAAFAAGAAVPFEDLVLLNLRGDLGWTEGAMGCSDLAWRRDRSVIAHNEDGGLSDLGRCGLTTPPPDGVRSDPGPDGQGLTTLCTLVADLTAGQATIAAPGESPVTVPLADLAEGNASAMTAPRT